MQIEEYDSAFRYLELAEQLDADSYTTSLNLGLIYHTLQRYDSAIVYIRKAIQLDNNKPKTWYQLACSYALAGRHEEAVANLKLAFEKGYKNTEVLLSDPDLFVLKENKSYQALLDKLIPDWRNQ